jgi:hypothetical protein
MGKRDEKWKKNFSRASEKYLSLSYVSFRFIQIMIFIFMTFSSLLLFSSARRNDGEEQE